MAEGIAGLQVGSGFIKIHADTDEAERKVGRFGDEGGGAFGRLKTAGAVAFGAIATGATAALGFGLNIAKDAESAKIGFETMLGSGEKADAFLKELKSFAAETPFEFPELREAGSRLLAVGTNAKDVIPIMGALGDATSGMGTGSEGIQRAVTALSQMQQKGKVTGEEMLQLTEAGIPGWDALATVMGVSVPEAQDAVSKGQVQVNTLMEAIQTRAGPAFQRLNGLMEKQSQSLEGIVSTLKDNVGELLGGLVGPLLPTIKGLVDSVGPVLTGLVKALAPAMEAIATALGPVLVDIMKALTPVIHAMAGAFADVLVAMLPLLPPIAELISALAPLFPVLAQLIVALLQLGLPVLVPLIGLVTNLAQVVVGLISGALQPVIEFLTGNFEPAFKSITAVLRTTGEFFKWVWDGIRNVVVSVGRAIGDFLTGLWAGISGAVSAAWNGIGGFLSGLWNGISANARGIFSAVAGFFSGLWGGIRDTAMAIWNGISTGVQAIWNGITGAARAVWGGITGFFRESFEGIRNLATTIFGSVRDRIMGPIESAKAGIESALGAIRRAWERVKDAIFDSVAAIIRRIKDLPFVPGSPIPMVVWAQQTARGVTEALGRMDLPDLANTSLPPALRRGLGVAGGADGLGRARGGYSRLDVTGEVVINLDGRTVARVITPFVRDEFADVGRLNGGAIIPVA